MYWMSGALLWFRMLPVAFALSTGRATHFVINTNQWKYARSANEHMRGHELKWNKNAKFKVAPFATNRFRWKIRTTCCWSRTKRLEKYCTQTTVARFHVILSMERLLIVSQVIYRILCKMKNNKRTKHFCWFQTLILL